MVAYESSEAIMNIVDNWGLPLPPHMASLIFSKLSIFNLPACRCVSKSWNHLVLDYAASCPKLHLPNMAIMITNFNLEQNPKIHCFDLHTFTFVATNTLVGPDVRDTGIYNCCNGLFIIGRQIYNPMTNEFFHIPELPPFQRPPWTGFGFSPKTKQYKLVKAVVIPTYELKILRFGSNHNQWTSIYLSSPIHLYSQGVYMNGTIYWIGKQKRNERFECVIYAFDVETENIEVIEFRNVRSNKLFRLQPFNGTLYVIITTKERKCQIQLWRMQDKNCWIRDFIVPSNFSNNWDVGAVHILKASELDGKMLLQIKRKLFWVKPGNKIERKEQMKILFPPKIIKYYAFPMESLHFGSPLHFGSLSSILAGDA